MRYCVVIPDGMADLPVERLDGRTPMEAARKPNMDRASREGLLGRVLTVPPRLHPGSAVAIMSVMGYDPEKYYTGRGPLEAADMGVELRDSEIAFRCNLITTDGGSIVDFTAGHVSTAEAQALMSALGEHLGGPEVTFYAGTSYRNLMVYSGSLKLSAETTAPHDVVGEPFAGHLPHGPGSETITGLMQRSVDVLADHEVNRVRRSRGQSPANMIWLWGQGITPSMEPFAEKYGGTGAAISAVNLIRGMARLIGWDVIHVPGATGYVDTDYAAKGRYAVDALGSHDLTFVHVEAPDEAAHEGDVDAKIGAIERIDADIIGPIMAAAARYPDLRLLIVPDHVTSVFSGKHMHGNVPFVIYGAGVKERSGLDFTEAGAARTDVLVEHGHELMGRFLGAIESGAAPH